MISATQASEAPTTPRKSFAKTHQVLEIPSLIQVQFDSFSRFQEEGLRELFQDLTIQDARLELRFLNCELGAPKNSMPECRERDLTYAAPLYAKVQLIVKETGEIKEQNIFITDIPLMTPNGTFIINGAERVVVSQLIRSPGLYLTTNADIASGRELCYGKLIPEHGSWLDFETTSKNVIWVKVNGKRRFPITTLLRAVGYPANEDIFKLFEDVDTSPDYSFVAASAKQDSAIKNENEAILEIYRRLRPGDLPNLENAKTLLNNLFFNPRHYNLGRVGRYKLNKRLGRDVSTIGQESLSLTSEDLVEIMRHIIMVNNAMEAPDDIDHLSNRRLRTVGELIQNHCHVALFNLERMIKERMSIVDPETVTPNALINTRPITVALRDFFSGSQLCQFMDQTNPLAELTHKRRLSTLGPGGLSRERAGFEVRDIHNSHYGRICPIETPEGPNIGLISSMATWASVDEYGFITTPYRRVLREVANKPEQLVGRTLKESLADSEGHVIGEQGTTVTQSMAKQIAKVSRKTVKVLPFVSKQIVYLPADKEEDYVIAQASAPLTEQDHFSEGRVEVRKGHRFYRETPEHIDFMDVSPKQIVGVSASLIPFLQHDDANRALMGSNMERQAVPLLCPESPIVGTGMERQVARDSGQLILAEADGEVLSVAGSAIVVRNDSGEEQVYPLLKFVRTNQGTCINQHPIVQKGQRVHEGQVLADSSATEEGILSLGQNVLCGFMSWEGYNFEDAIIVSERIVRDDKFTSIHIERYEVEARETKLGAEEITRDIPNVGEESLRKLDDDGIIQVGATVESGDILVGKITPKGETELTAEEKLLRVIFGEKAREVKDTSLRVPHGEKGLVIAVKTFVNRDELPEGVSKLVRVWIAQKRKGSEGDKLAGRHGNKGVIARILPVEDMPFLPDGTPLDIILNPIGVPSRMNLGQIFEAHLGWAANELGFKCDCPVFEGPDTAIIEDALAKAWIVRQANAGSTSLVSEPGERLRQAESWLEAQGENPGEVFGQNHDGNAKWVCLRLWLKEQGVSVKGLSNKQVQHQVEKVSREKQLSPPIYGKTPLYDGRTGRPFDQPVTVGYVYVMKLIHLVEDKVHARSTGPYTLITQQPLGGKAQFGGQRFGEMEVWALEAYGAAYTLQELLTIKSDDIAGRAKAYEAITKGDDVHPPGLPESFNVLVRELQSLGLAVELSSGEKI
ncbi:MAG: DNA-directed RNA polymerase subunit beta [Chloroflexi bacterium]|nr:DNA-directed RNA polymerase subunit beta [Chloroflexota bacterium]